MLITSKSYPMLCNFKIETSDNECLFLGGRSKNESSSTFVVFWFQNDEDSWRRIRYKIGCRLQDDYFPWQLSCFPKLRTDF